MAPNSSGDTHRYTICDDIAPSRATYLAVAEARGCDPLRLPPLGRSVDTESLDALADGTEAPDVLADGATATERLCMSFEYAGCPVTVTPDEVRVDVR